MFLKGRQCIGRVIMFSDKSQTATGPTKERLEATKRACAHGAGWDRKPRAKARDLEHLEQCIVVEWLELKREQGWRFFSVPSGGHRHISVAVKLKAEGSQKGVQDIMIFPPNGLNIALEMKATEGGRLSPEQKEWRDFFRARPGWFAYVADGADKAIEFLEVAGRNGDPLSVKWALEGGGF